MNNAHPFPGILKIITQHSSGVDRRTVFDIILVHAKDKGNQVFIHDSTDDMVVNRSETWKIILADDEQEVHKVSRLVFNSLTYQGKPCTILSAYSGKETIVLLNKHPDTAIVILDMVMEEEDSGFAVARYIRTSLKKCPIQIFMRTGYPLKTSENTVLSDLDINLVTSKPECTAGVLKTSVLSLLKGYDTLQQYTHLNRLLIKKLDEEKKKNRSINALYDQIFIPVSSAGLGTWDFDLNTGLLSIDSHGMENGPKLPLIQLNEIYNRISETEKQNLSESFFRHLEGITPCFEGNFSLLPADTVRWHIRGKLTSYENPNHVNGVFWKTNETGSFMNESLFKTMIESLTDVIFHIDTKGIINYVNPHVYRITGYTPDQLLGKSYTCLIQPELKHEISSYHKSLFNSGEVEASLEFPLLHNDGSTRWVEGIVRRSCGGKAGDYFQGTLRDITQRKKTEEHLKHLAFHDALTGLPNRVLLREKLDHLIALSRRHGTRIGLLFLDLNNFKHVNDTRGHEAGDNLLKGVAQRLLDIVREIDVVARFGGDEFVMILDELNDRPDLIIIMDRVMMGFMNYIDTDSGRFTISVSIGASMYPDDAQDCDGLVRCADEALYRAKRLVKTCHAIPDKYSATVRGYSRKEL